MNKDEQVTTGKGFKVRIFDLDKGLIEYENIKAVRMISQDYNLLIMEDYLPIIGEIEGSVKLELVKDSVVLKNIKGYFMNKKNQFNLFIKEEEENE